MPDDRHDRHDRHPHSRRRTGRSRSRSPYHGDHKRRRSHTPSREDAAKAKPRSLPLDARQLDRRDYKAFEGLFALYLDVQKQLVLEELEEREAKGRWKSFVNKWNRGDLAEGWYDPETYKRAQASLQAAPSSPPASTSTKPNTRLDNRHETSQSKTRSSEPRAAQISTTRDYGAAGNADADANAASGEDDDDYGPSLPTTLARTTTTSASRATIPSLQDLALARESDLEAQHTSLLSHRADRKSHRQLAASRLDELAPRAEPGTRERQLEKKREVGAANRSFAQAKTDGGGVVEMGDEELMGGGGDELEELKKRKGEMEKRKSDRDLRREEVLRAKQAEREERMRVYREKEEETMRGLVELARARFG